MLGLFEYLPKNEAEIQLIQTREQLIQTWEWLIQLCIQLTRRWLQLSLKEVDQESLTPRSDTGQARQRILLFPHLVVLLRQAVVQFQLDKGLRVSFQLHVYV